MFVSAARDFRLTDAASEVLILAMLEPAPTPSPTSEPAAPAYEPPTLVELGTLKDLTAAGSFIDPT